MMLALDFQIDTTHDVVEDYYDDLEDARARQHFALRNAEWEAVMAYHGYSFGNDYTSYEAAADADICDMIAAAELAASRPKPSRHRRRPHQRRPQPHGTRGQQRGGRRQKLAERALKGEPGTMCFVKFNSNQVEVIAAFRPA